jgi:hypothetical protein
MAVEIVERRLDDIFKRGGVRKEADVTVEFAYKGRRYTIDLTTANEKEFDDAILPFLEAASEVTGRRKETPVRRAPSTSPAPTAKKKPNKAANNDTEAIREWARAQGLKVSDRGRISNEIKTAYYAGHPKPQSAVASSASVDESEEPHVEESAIDEGFDDLYDQDLYQS